MYSADELPYGKRRGITNRFEPFGTAIVWIERIVLESTQATEVPLGIERSFEISLECIIDEVAEYMEDNEGPYLTGALITAGPGFNDRDSWKTQGMWQGAEMTLEWGYRN